MEREDLHEDMPVMVTTGVSSRRNCEGKVVKIARRYVKIEYIWAPGCVSTMDFDIVTQKERGAESNYASVFRTMEQYAHDERVLRAQEGLRDFKLTTAHQIMSEHPLGLVEAIISLVEEWKWPDEQEPS